MIDVDRFRADVESARSQGYECVTIPTCHYAGLLNEIERLRERNAKLERVREAAKYAINWVEDLRWRHPLFLALQAAKEAADG